MLRLLAVLILTATAALTFAQQSSPPEYTLNVDVELVQLPVSVVDKNGHPVRGLRQEDFAVYEDKVMQDIVLFKQEDVPLSVGLVVDASGSMQMKHDRLSKAALTFVQESNPEDETFIVSFADYARLVQDFTTDHRRLKRALDRISPAGDTALYDAVRFASKRFENAFHDKKVLLVVSDGQDNRSDHKLDEVLDHIRESDFVVYTVGLFGLDGFNSNWPFKPKAKKVLEGFAKVTGGRAFFPKSLEDVDEVCRRIARDLRNQYTIGYRPSNEKRDGSWRVVKVQLNPSKRMPKATVRTRQGYYAPSISNAQTNPSVVR
jgi:VWFA-related protein